MADFPIKILTQVDDNGSNAAANQLDKLGESAQKASKEVKGAEISHRQLGAALREIGAGPIAELTHFMANPWLLAIMGIVTAVKLLIDRWKEHHETLVKNIAAGREMAEMFKNNHLEALREVTAATAKFNIELDHSGDRYSAIAHDAERYLAVTKEQVALNLSLASSIDQVTAAHIRENLTAGRITGGQASAQEAALARAELVRKQKAEEDEIARKIAAIQWKMQQPGGDPSVVAADAKAALPGEREQAARLGEQIHDAQGIADEAAKKTKDLQAPADEAQANLTEKLRGLGYDFAQIDAIIKGLKSGEITPGQTMAAVDARKFVDAQSALDQNEAEIQAQKDLIVQYTALKSAVEANIALHQKQAEEKPAEADKVNEEFQDLKKQLEDLITQHQATLAADDEATASNRRIAEMNTGYPNTIQGRADFDIETMADATADPRAGKAQLLDLIKKMASELIYLRANHVLPQDLADIKAQLDALNSRVKHMR